MTFQDTVELAARSLSQAKLRTALTTLGVSIGIASLAGMISLGIGLQDQVVGRFQAAGTFDNIMVTTQADLPGALAQLGQRGGPLRARMGRGANSEAALSPAAKLDTEAIQKIAALDHVRDVFPNVRVPVEMTLDEFSATGFVTGIAMSSKGEGAFQSFSYGGFFNGDSDKSCVLSPGMARRISKQDPGGLIGRSLTISYAATLKGEAGDSLAGFQVRRVDLPCRIAGIVDRDASIVPGGGGGGGVMVPMGLAKTIEAEIVMSAQSLMRDPSQPKFYDSLTVKVTHPQFTEDIEDRLRRMGYSAFSASDAVRGAKNAFIILDMFLSLIGSIALAVSSLGIVNTMVTSILQRTREIGIMKAVGASDSDISRIFLFEASGIGLMGGVAGIAIGWAAGRLINFGANLYIQNQGGTPGTLFSLPPWLIAGAIGFSMVVSFAAGSYPASRAARLDPIQALRHD